jgi:hypothetical protein
VLLKKNLEPTDFADADCRVSGWTPYSGPATSVTGYRVWICRCGGGYWFQRHEWSKEGRNSTEMDGWIFSGYSPYRRWGNHYLPAPKEEL